MNLYINELRKQSNKIGIICHHASDYKTVTKILGYVIPDPFENPVNGFIILNVHEPARFNITDDDVIFIQAKEFIKRNTLLSEDGVLLYPYNNVYAVNIKDNHRMRISDLDHLLNNNLLYPTKYLYFSTPEAAKEYVEKNRIFFTTSDGVEIKIGDTYYVVTKETLTISGLCICSGLKPALIHNTFSTKEKAEEYVKVEKNKIIAEDGGTINLGDTFYYVTKPNLLIHQTTNKGDWPYMHIVISECVLFTSKENALKYIERNEVYLKTEDGGEIKLGDEYWAVETENFNILYRIMSGKVENYPTKCVFFATRKNAVEYVNNTKRFSVNDLKKLIDIQTLTSIIGESIN